MFLSCAGDIDVDYSHVFKRLAIQSRLVPDEPFTIHISSSVLPTDHGGFPVPQDLAVSLIDVTNGSVITLERQENVYVSPQALPQAGHQYKLFLVAPGYPAVEALTAIPQPVAVLSGAIENLRYVPSEITDHKMNLTYELRLDFEPHDWQYLHLRFLQTTALNVGTIDTPVFEEYAYFIEPEFNDQRGFYEHHETGVLIDLHQAGGPSVMYFSFNDFTVGDAEELGDLYIEVRTVMPDYHHYFVSLARQLISRDDPFAEPIPVYNNIQGGIGNFSAFNRIVYFVPVVP